MPIQQLPAKVWGPELIVNGTFNTNLSGWSVNSISTPGATIVWEAPGRIKFDPTDNFQNIANVMTSFLEQGKTYSIEFDWQVTGWAPGNVLAWSFGSGTGNSAGGNANFVVNLPSTSGHYAIDFVHNGESNNSNFFNLQVGGDAAPATVWYDNVTVKELLGSPIPPLQNVCIAGQNGNVPGYVIAPTQMGFPAGQMSIGDGKLQ